MANKIVLVIASLLLVSCVQKSSPSQQYQSQEQALENVRFIQYGEKVDDSVRERHMARIKPSLQTIAAAMSKDLFESDRGVRKGEPITVTSFVNLNSLEDTNWLGIQLPEIFIHQLHQQGFFVVDYKTTGNIKVTNKGDFVFTRDWKQLKQFHAITRVLTATMARSEKGVLINARIIDMTTRQVDATAQGLIPNHLLLGSLDSLGSLMNKDGYIIRTSKPDNQKRHLVELTH